MRITTWNINGLRAGITKNAIENMRALDSDVLCLQEIKSRPDQLSRESLDALHSMYPFITWHPAQRPGYSGTATLTRRQPLAEEIGLGYPEFDGEGRLISTHYPGFRLFNIYFPNGQHDLGRVPFKLDFYARLLDLCDRLHKQGELVILCGDFNTAHKPMDLAHPRQNATATGFLPEERAWIDRYLEHGFIDAFRSLYPDKVEYTWWTYLSNARKNNVGWRLDYFLVSARLLDKVNSVTTHSQVMGSDHCPVTIEVWEE